METTLTQSQVHPIFEGILKAHGMVPEKKVWRARTVNGIFQINFDTEYRGYNIQPDFLYDNGTMDCLVFKGDDENGTMFHAVTLSSVKEWINDELEENPQVIIVKTYPDKGDYNLTKFNSLIGARLFADRFNGVIQ